MRMQEDITKVALGCRKDTRRLNGKEAPRGDSCVCEYNLAAATTLDYNSFTIEEALDRLFLNEDKILKTVTLAQSLAQSGGGRESNVKGCLVLDMSAEAFVVEKLCDNFNHEVGDGDAVFGTEMVLESRDEGEASSANGGNVEAVGRHVLRQLVDDLHPKFADELPALLDVAAAVKDLCLRGVSISLQQSPLGIFDRSDHCTHRQKAVVPFRMAEFLILQNGLAKRKAKVNVRRLE